MIAAYLTAERQLRPIHPRGRRRDARRPRVGGARLRATERDGSPVDPDDLGDLLNAALDSTVQDHAGRLSEPEIDRSPASRLRVDLQPSSRVADLERRRLEERFRHALEVDDSIFEPILFLIARIAAVSGWKPVGRRKKRLDSTMSTPERWLPAMLCWAARRAKSPTFPVSTENSPATAAPNTSGSDNAAK